MKALEERQNFFYGYVVVTAAVFIMTIVWGTNRTFGVFLKPMLSEFGWSRASISGAFTAAMVVMGLASFPAGRITDRFGPRAVVIICGLCLCLGYFFTSRITAVWQFYIYYGLMAGIGMSITTPLMSLVARWFVKRRALMSSIVTAGPAFGNMVVPLIFSAVVQSVGWRFSYVIMAGAVLVFIVAAGRFVKRDPAEMGLCPLGTDVSVAHRSIQEMDGLSMSEALGTNQYWLLSFVFFCDFFLMNVVTVHIVIYAMDLGISAIKAASVLSVASGVCIIARIIIGGIADKIGCKPTLTACLVLAVMGFALLLVTHSLWTLYLFAAIFGFGLWSSGGLITPMTADLFGLRSHGAIYGSIFISGAIGGAFGPVLIGYLFDVTGNYAIPFTVCFGISIFSLLALVALKPLGR
ncbi:MAG: MFS transporter [Deltaproteobacteria bacterium]|nr:MFS transporter [Deltaproteobacteria bacterium]MBW1962121.1 MFS transporter [Deltaproteobacteria bacterium]MBW2152831.1 MFS transporter [Deltaproteobacteria bacterium]